mgnify:CR=1 FL=1
MRSSESVKTAVFLTTMGYRKFPKGRNGDGDQANCVNALSGNRRESGLKMYLRSHHPPDAKAYRQPEKMCRNLCRSSRNGGGTRVSGRDTNYCRANPLARFGQRPGKVLMLRLSPGPFRTEWLPRSIYSDCLDCKRSRRPPSWNQGQSSPQIQIACSR